MPTQEETLQLRQYGDRILGEILLDNSRYEFYRQRIHLESVFPYSDVQNFIFGVMGEILADGNEIDIVNLIDKLKHYDALDNPTDDDESITIPYLCSLIDGVPHIATESVQ